MRDICLCLCGFGVSLTVVGAMCSNDVVGVLLAAIGTIVFLYSSVFYFLPIK